MTFTFSNLFSERGKEDKFQFLFISSFKIMYIPQVEEQCKANTLCPISMAATAYCGRCDFDSSAHICAWVKGSQNATEKEANQDVCPTAEEIVYSGGPNRYSFTGKRKWDHCFFCDI